MGHARDRALAFFFGFIGLLYRSSGRRRREAPARQPDRAYESSTYYRSATRVETPSVLGSPAGEKAGPLAVSPALAVSGAGQEEP